MAERYLRKGSKVYVSGAFTVRKWTGQDGSDKYVTEIVLGKFRGELVLLGDKQADSRSDTGRASSSASPPGFDDEIPF